MSEAELATNSRQFEEAKSFLLKLTSAEQRQIAALRLSLRVEQGLSNWSEVLRLVKQLEKHKALTETQGDALRTRALREMMSHLTDIAQIKQFWQDLSRNQRLDPVLLQKLVRALIETGEKSAAAKHLENFLSQHAHAELSYLYSDCVENDATPLLARAESWLAKRPQDDALLLTLGRLCVKQQLWSKAQSYFEAALSVRNSSRPCLELAKLFDKLGNVPEAEKYWRKLALLNEAERHNNLNTPLSAKPAAQANATN